MRKVPGARQANSYYPFQQVDGEVVEPSTGMVKSRSANTLARRRQKAPEMLMKNNSVDNSSRGGMTRDPISVPNFRALTLPTPVLTPVEASRLVFVDPDEDSDEEKREPPTSRLIEVAEEKGLVKKTNFSIWIYRLPENLEILYFYAFFVFAEISRLSTKPANRCEVIVTVPTCTRLCKRQKRQQPQKSQHRRR